MLLGELALDGRVRPVQGVLPAVLAAKRQGWPAVVVPIDNLAEASLVDGIEVLGVRTLRQLQAWLSRRRRPWMAGSRRLPRSPNRWPTSPTWSARPRPGSRSRSPPPARTT